MKWLLGQSSERQRDGAGGPGVVRGGGNGEEGNMAGQEEVVRSE